MHILYIFAPGKISLTIFGAKSIVTRVIPHKKCIKYKKGCIK